MKIFPKEWSTLWSDIITLALSAAGLIMGEEPLLSVIGAAVKGTDYLNISPIILTYLRAVQLSVSTPFRSFSTTLGKKIPTQKVGSKI